MAMVDHTAPMALAVEYFSTGAEISPCGKYRYRLWRAWNIAKNPPLTVLMLNPSTADGSTDDPTIRKVVGFADRMGYGGIEVINLFALRTSSPSKLFAELREHGMSYASGPTNDAAIQECVLRSRKIWLAYGVLPTRAISRESVVLRLVEGVPAFTLGRNKYGTPKHPLYLPYSASQTQWTAS